MLNPTTAKAVIAWFPAAIAPPWWDSSEVGLPFGGALGALIMPPLAIWLGWRAAVALSATVIALLAGLSWLLYRDPPEPAGEQRAGARG